MSSKKDISRLRKNRILHFQLGFICALCFVTLAFNYTTETVRLKYDEVIELPDQPIEVVPPTDHLWKKPPPPPPPVATLEKIEVVDELPPEDPIVQKEPEPIQIPISQAVKFVPTPEPTKEPVKDPSPVIQEPIEDEIIEEPDFYIVVAEMPRFKGCEEDGSKECTDSRMMKFVYKHLKYPRIASENGIEGLVIVEFIVDKDGSVTDVKTLKHVGGGCSQEAERVVKLMPKWTPGKQTNRNVKVKYSLPVNFKLK